MSVDELRKDEREIALEEAGR